MKTVRLSSCKWMVCVSVPHTNVCSLHVFHKYKDVEHSITLYRRVSFCCGSFVSWWISMFMCFFTQDRHPFYTSGEIRSIFLHSESNVQYVLTCRTVCETSPLGPMWMLTFGIFLCVCLYVFYVRVSVFVSECVCVCVCVCVCRDGRFSPLAALALCSVHEQTCILVLTRTCIPSRSRDGSQPVGGIGLVFYSGPEGSGAQ